MYDINGLSYIPQYIGLDHHDRLMETVDKQLWRNDLTRRTQHYGYVYDYRAKTVDISMYLGELPVWLQDMAKHLYDDGLISEIPDQVIINEYQPGQGIADHVDCMPCFGDVIFSLSLGSSVVMDLKQAGKTVQILLEPCSLLVLSGEARYKWTHGIPKRKQDNFVGQIINRKRRISLTFRKVIVSDA